MITQIIITSIGILGSIASILAAIISINEKKQVEKYKYQIEKRFIILEHNDIYIEAQTINRIIIKYRTNKIIGTNKTTDESKIFSFITKIKEYSYLLQNKVADEYFETMEKSISANDFNTMYLIHSELIQKLRTESRGELLNS